MTALEIFYKTQKPTSDVQEKAIDEFMGLPIKKKNIGLFHRLLDILDRPGNATRALLVGKLGGLKGMIPFAQTFENLTGLDVAMNKDELVTGVEVIEKWFGKQEQRKGKLDPVDVLGFMVEVAAEPLWLVGIGGLTKAGKAARLAQSARAMAKAAPDTQKAFATLKTIFRAAKTGKPIAKEQAKLYKAFQTLIKSGMKPQLAKTWATQATKGQRALFKFAGKPVIKGERALGALERAGAKLKAGRLGKVFLPPTRQVPVKYKELHDIYVHFGRDLPHVERTKYFNRLKELYQQGATKGLSAEDMDKVVRKYVQRAYAGEGAERFVKMRLSQRHKIALAQIKKIAPKYKTTKEKLARKTAAYKVAGELPERPTPALARVPKPREVGIIPEIKGFAAYKKIPKIKPIVRELKTRIGRQVAQAYEKRIAQLQNNLNKLKALGTKADKKQIAKLEYRIERMQVKAYIDGIKGYNKEALRKYQKLIAGDKAKVAKYQARFNAEIKQAEKELRSLQRQIEQKVRFAKGKKIQEGRLVDVESIAGVKAQVPLREQQAKALLAEQPELAGKIKGIGKEYKGLHEELIRGELAAGAPAKQITYPIGYASRRPTEAFREFLEANKHRPVVASFSRDLSARNPAQRMRNKVLGFMADDEALDYFKKLGFKGKDVFEPGMAMPTMQRAAMSTRTVGAGRTVDEALKKFSKPDMPYWRGKGYTFSADEIMEKVGLRPEVAATMRGRIVPQDVADALLNMHSLATSEESLAGFWKAWVGTQRYMKGAFTMPWPAYHGRNMFSNFVLNWINGVQNPQSYMEALAIQLGRGKAIRLATGQVLSPDDILKHADDWGILGRSVGMFAPEEIGGQAIIGAKGVVKRHFLGQGKIRQTGQKLGVAVENNARLAHFIDKLKKGYNFNDAAVSAKKVLFDYGDLSRIEKRFLRDRGVFFYTFMRKNLPLQMETLLKQPGKQAVWSHLAGGAPAMAKDEPMPDWWREQIVTRPLFTTKKGEEMRIAGLGVPMEEAFGSFAGPGHSMWEGARRIAARQFGRLSPPITATTEFVTGKDIFYNKPISKLGYAPTWPTKHFPEPVKKALGVRPITYEGRPTRYTMSPQAAWALRKSPLARAWSSAAMLSREEEPAPIRASHFLTGFKPRMINPELQRQIGERRATKRYLEDQFQAGKVRRFERYYTPKEWPKDEKMEALLRSQ